MRWATLVERLRSSLWFLPSIFLVAAIIQAWAIPAWEESQGDVGTFLFEGGPDGARVLLSMIAGSTLTLTVLVFSITIVALQLASSQFSPRVLRTFLRDWYSQVALGVFTATFAYSITVLRSVRSDEGDSEAFVPTLSVSLAFFWAIASLAVFVLYVHHTARSIRVATVIARIGKEARRTIAQEFPDRPSPAPRDRLAAPVVQAVVAPVSGLVLDVDLGRLRRLAEEADAVVVVAVPVGDFVPVGGTLLEVHGATMDPAAAQRCVSLGNERTMIQDLRFGFRQLVDIAERALSPAVNDPTTAVQALDQLHDLLRRLAVRPWPTGQVLGSDGCVRVVVPLPSWDEVVHLAIDEIRLAGAGSVQVDRRLRLLLEDLIAVTPDERRAPLEEELRLVSAGVNRTLGDEADRRRALVGDQVGPSSPTSA